VALPIPLAAPVMIATLPAMERLSWLNPFMLLSIYLLKYTVT
jgi:hypothetical protein